jgi:hypothetical protein
MPTSPHIANMIPIYYIPTNAQQAGLGTAECLASQEHPDPPRMPPPGVMMPVQQSTFISQHGKENILLENYLYLYYLYLFILLLPAWARSLRVLRLTIKYTEP